MMLPPQESRLLNCLTVRAVELAADGCVGEGYTYLLEGYGRVRRLEAAGEPAGPELVSHYRRLLDDYAGRYNMARE